MSSHYESREERLAVMRSMNLFSNDFMNVALEDKAACEYVLRILTKIPDLCVQTVTVQWRVAHSADRDVVIDVLAEDSRGRLYNVEVQRGDGPDHFKRIRLYRAEIDSKMMEKGSGYDALPELYIIYLSETDILHSGLAWDEVESTFRRSREGYSDGSHIIFVNGAVDEKDEISRLMKYFKTADPEDRTHGALSDYVYMLKRTEKGADIMCDKAKLIFDGGAFVARADAVITLMKNTGWSMETTMDQLGIDAADRPEMEALIRERMDGRTA